ncbi:MAG TPA: UDP-N-acetylmuramoyl-L-alanine--D-glutamate ligase [Thermomicrobiales bacterium]|nr:UDP-N-acetylmuramoyl-L-alanine--D-glutamate ligase [Thermomicrobiales bacterium]
MGRTNDLRNKRATLVGLGTLGGGVGVARYLVAQGARVTVTDMRDRESLAGSIEALQGLPITWHLGGHDVRDFHPDGADLVVRNPGVPRDSAFLKTARKYGVPIEMEMSLFFRACPAPVIGVTGTKGKTTVSTLIGEMLTVWDPTSVVAGNMGVSALAALDRITPETPAVVELSSWQLEAMHEHRLGPKIAVLTNIHEDHLNHYNGFEDYASTKRTIGAHVPEDGVVIYNADQPDTRRISEVTRACLFPFGLQPRGGEGAWLDDEALVVRWNGRENRYGLPTHLALRGPAGIANALAAIAAATARGVPTGVIAGALRSFAGVPNRLELIASCGGTRFINDTSATAPAAAAATIRLLAHEPGELTVIGGGADKSSDFSPLADAVAHTGVRLVLLDGSGTARLQEALREHAVEPQTPFGSLADAFEAAAAGDTNERTVVLSPGCASFGMFRNEFDRGDQFRELVRAWCAEHQPDHADVSDSSHAR